MANQQSPYELKHARAPFSAWLGIVLMFVAFGVIVLAIVGPSPRTDDYEQKRARARLEKLKALNDEHVKALTSYAWIDKNKGTVRLPIERAMELTMIDLAGKQPAPAGPVATPTPEPAAAPAPHEAPVPAPGASPSATPAKTL